MSRVKPEGANAWMTIISKDIPSRDFYLGLWNKKPYFSYDITSDNHQSPYALLDNKWSHILFTRDYLGNVSLYVNNNFIGSKTISDSSNWVGSELNIGGYKRKHRDGNYEDNFKGVIDDLRIYDRVLLEDEIKYLAEN